MLENSFFLIICGVIATLIAVKNVAKSVLTEVDIAKHGIEPKIAVAYHRKLFHTKEEKESYDICRK